MLDVELLCVALLSA